MGLQRKRAPCFQMSQGRYHMASPGSPPQRSRTLMFIDLVTAIGGARPEIRVTGWRPHAGILAVLESPRAC